MLPGKAGFLAAQMAVEDFSGKVLGAPIEVISGDHQNKPDIGAGIARRWIDTDHVDVIVDVPTSSVALAIEEVTREKKRLFLMSGPASSDLIGKAARPTAFNGRTIPTRWPTAPAVLWSNKAVHSWFFITADYAFGHALERDTGNAVKAAGGSVLGAVRAPLNTRRFLVVPAAGPSLQGESIGPANAGGDTINSIKQPRNSESWLAARSSRGCRDPA